MISPCYNSCFAKIQYIWKNVWLHFLFYFAIHCMDGCNWNCELTQYLWKKRWLRVVVSKKHSTLENTSYLQRASCNNDDTTQIYDCKCSFETTIHLKQKYLSNTLIGNLCLQVLFEKTPYRLRNGWPQLKIQKKHCTLKKKLFAAIKNCNLQRKNVLGTTTLDQYFLYFTKSFVHLSVIPAGCYFSIYK